jgi:hypothetical protein
MIAKKSGMPAGNDLPHLQQKNGQKSLEDVCRERTYALRLPGIRHDPDQQTSQQQQDNAVRQRMPKDGTHGKRRTALSPVKQTNQGRTSQAGLPLIHCE